MLPVSKLASLYQAIYRKPPSSHSMAALLAMEQLLGITDDDPLARMLVVLLHSADRFDQVGDQVLTALRERTDDERLFLSELERLMGKTERLVDDLRSVRAPIRQRAAAAYGDGGKDLRVEVYNKTSPLLSYIRKAFGQKRTGLDDDDVIGAARWDLFYLFCTGAVLVLLGVGVDRFGI